MLDLHTREHGYTEVLPPYLVNSASLTGTGQLPKFEEDMFNATTRARTTRAVQDSTLAIPTAEVPVTNLYRDEILDEAQLTTSYCAYTPCFRREAGSYGKDTRGMIRQHQFQKVELVKFAAPQTHDEHEELTRDAEASSNASGCPIAACCCAPATWASPRPRPTTSRSGCPGRGLPRDQPAPTSRTSRRAAPTSASGRPATAGQAETEFVHTLNGSGLAVGRTCVAVLENYQQADGRSHSRGAAALHERSEQTAR